MNRSKCIEGSEDECLIATNVSGQPVTGGIILKFPNVKSGKAFASGGYGLFILRRVG